MPSPAFALPTTTTAVVDRAGGPLAIERLEVPLAPQAADEVLVEVEAFSVNRGELALLASRPDGWRPGQDLAGRVIASAPNHIGPKVDDRVVAVVEGGGWANHVHVPIDRLAILPDTVESPAAATLGIAGLTALRILRLHGPLLGIPVLVTGASGAVGRFLVQLAALQGARVTAVATSHQDELRAIGAETVLSSPIQANKRFELVLESVGGNSLTEAIATTAPRATVVVYGNTSGERTPLTLYDFIGHEDVRLQTYFSYAQPDPPAAGLALLVELLATGELQAPIGRVAGWDQLQNGLNALQDREISGKLVLTIS